MKIYHESIPASIPTGKIAVTVYGDRRSYGGPEEGGWWYRDPFVLEVRVFNSLRKAKVYLKSITPLPTHLRNHFACLEFPGHNPTEVDSEGHLVSARPYHLRQVYRDRELLCRPHYC